MTAVALLESITLLAAATNNFSARAIEGLTATDRGPKLVEQGLMLATALAPVIGYDDAAKLAKDAFASGRTIRELALERGMDPAELERLLDPASMTEPGLGRRSRRRLRPRLSVGSGRPRPDHDRRRRSSNQRERATRMISPMAVQHDPKTSHAPAHGRNIAPAASTTSEPEALVGGPDEQADAGGRDHRDRLGGPQHARIGRAGRPSRPWPRSTRRSRRSQPRWPARSHRACASAARSAIPMTAMSRKMAATRANGTTSSR